MCLKQFEYSEATSVFGTGSQRRNKQLSWRQPCRKSGFAIKKNPACFREKQDKLRRDRKIELPKEGGETDCFSHPEKVLYLKTGRRGCGKAESGLKPDIGTSA